jgi:TrmH RNA methyltransferase
MTKNPRSRPAKVNRTAPAARTARTRTAATAQAAPGARTVPAAKAAPAAPTTPARALPEIELIYGLHSGLEVFARRRADILRIHFEHAVRPQVQNLLRWAVEAGVPHEEVTDTTLAARADSKQHEGLLLEVRARSWSSLKELSSWLVAEKATAVALDQVRNPQNIGAILRSAAFFGVSAVILGAPAPHPGLPPFALRVAEGGAEHLRFARTTDLAATLKQLSAAGIQILGTDSHAGVPLSDTPLRLPSLLVLGNERVGLSPRIRDCCHASVGITGSGRLDSLNVAVAAGVMFAELWQRRNG